MRARSSHLAGVTPHDRHYRRHRPAWPPVIQSLLAKPPATQIVAAVRNPARAVDLAAQGVQIRQADYTDPASLVTAFQGRKGAADLVERDRSARSTAPQRHRCGEEGRRFTAAYTSILHADRSPLGLAAEHAATEAYLRESGMPNVLLRNGWCAPRTIWRASRRRCNTAPSSAVPARAVFRPPRAPTTPKRLRLR